MEVFELKSLTEFYQWKEQIERKTCSSYVQQRGLVKRPNGDFLLYFDCNRSGEYTPHGKGIRKVKSNSSKIGSKCASNIRIKVTDSGQRVIVKYSKNHDKHSPQAEFLRLPKTVRASIADQLKVGVPAPLIITAIRDVSADSNENRRFLIKRKDIRNIKRDFNIKNDIVKYNVDKASLKSWAARLMEQGYVSPVLPFRKETGCKNTAGNLDLQTSLTSSSPNLTKFAEANLSPMSKAQAFIQLYQQTESSIGEENRNKIHELLNNLINICTQVKNTPTTHTDHFKMEHLLKEKIVQEEDSLALSKKDILLMHNYYKPLSSKDIGMDVTEELFELEEVFEESKFYEDMVNEDFAELDTDILDEVLNIHTEFDHNYL